MPPFLGPLVAAAAGTGAAADAVAAGAAAVAAAAAPEPGVTATDPAGTTAVVEPARDAAPADARGGDTPAGGCDGNGTDDGSPPVAVGKGSAAETISDGDEADGPRAETGRGSPIDGTPGSESAPDDSAALAGIEDPLPPKGTPDGRPATIGGGGAGSGGKPVAGDALPTAKPRAAAAPRSAKGLAAEAVPKDGIDAELPRAMRRRRAISAWLLASCTSREWICCCCCINTAWVANWLSSPPAGGGVVAGTPTGDAIEATALVGMAEPIPVSVAEVPTSPLAAAAVAKPVTGRGSGGDAATAAAAASATAPALLGELSLIAGKGIGGSGSNPVDINGLGSSAGTVDVTAPGVPPGGCGDMAAVLRKSTTHEEATADSKRVDSGRRCSCHRSVGAPSARTRSRRTGRCTCDGAADDVRDGRLHDHKYGVIGNTLQGRCKWTKSSEVNTKMQRSALRRGGGAGSRAKGGRCELPPTHRRPKPANANAPQGDSCRHTPTCQIA